MLMPVSKRLTLVDRKYQKLSIVKQCKALEVPRSSLYYKPKSESEINLEIMKLMDKQFFHTPFYGIRKMTVWLNTQGYNVNRKRVKRLMKRINWQTIYREPRTTICNPDHEKYPYLLRDLPITHKNQVWATDITYIPMEKGFMYLFAIIDLHTRYVLNWELSNTMSTECCSGLLTDTIEKYGKPDIFNTDQGSQYTSKAHTQILKDNGIRISMDGKGRALDNIFIERLWRSVKYEDVYLQAYTDGKSLHKGLKKYFDFYNKERFHESLKYKTPEQCYYDEIAA